MYAMMNTVMLMQFPVTQFSSIHMIKYEGQD